MFKVLYNSGRKNDFFWQIYYRLQDMIVPLREFVFFPLKVFDRCVFKAIFCVVSGCLIVQVCMAPISWTVGYQMLKVSELKQVHDSFPAFWIFFWNFFDVEGREIIAHPLEAAVLRANFLNSFTWWIASIALAPYKNLSGSLNFDAFWTISGSVKSKGHKALKRIAHVTFCVVVNFTELYFL